MTEGLALKPVITQMNDSKGACPFLGVVHLNLILGAKQPGDKEKVTRVSLGSWTVRSED
jgi:hypothetical protein